MRIIISNTLILLLIGVLLPAASVADDYDPLTTYKGYVEREKWRTLMAARGVNNQHTLMTELGGKYDSSKSAIAAGNTRTVAAAFGVTLTAFATGGQSVAWAGIVSAVTNASMTAVEKRAALTAIGGMSLIDAYESAIEDKIEAIRVFDGHVAVYNMNHFAYSEIYDAHYSWDTHEGAGSGSNGTHDKDDWTDDWKINRSLPSFPCGGSCGNSFNTPTSEHWVKCGYRQSILKHPEYFRRKTEGQFPGHIIHNLLKDRPAAEGCGRHYYNCEDEAEHQLLTCQRDRKRWEGSSIVIKACLDDFRRCMGQKRDHDPSDGNWFDTQHSDKADSNDGDQETDGYVAPSPTPTPSYHTCGTHVTTVSGNHESAGCGTTGHYQCDSKTHTAAVCGTSGHYDCDEKDHSMQASCLINSSCTVANFYKCQSHTCQATCASGHTYDPRNAVAVNKHRTRTCRFPECRQTWQKCVVSSAPICNKPYRKKNGLSCWAEE